jgi:hypothetical protein
MDAKFKSNSLLKFGHVNYPPVSGTLILNQKKNEKAMLLYLPFFFT